MTAHPDKYTRMTETPVERLIVSLAIPTIISMLVTAIYNSADKYFVGSISTQASAAVSVVFAVMSIIQATGFFCGHGSGNYMSRQIGAGNRKEAEEAGATGLLMAFILGTCVMAAGLLFLYPLARFLGATETMMADTVGYLRIILCGAPVMIPQIVLNNQLRFQGSAVYSMIGLVSGALLNIVLDPVFIFVLGMGVAGAALATVLSQGVGLIVLYAGTMRGDNIRVLPKNIRINRHYLYEIANGGAPSLFRQGMSSISTVILNHMAGVYGAEAAAVLSVSAQEAADCAIAGMGITTQVMMILNAALIGFGQGMQPTVSFNYGAGKYDRVKKAFIFSVRVASVFSSVVAVFCLSFAPAIIRFFRDDEAVVTVGKTALRFQASALFVFGFAVMSNMMMQSIGKGIRASVMAASRSGIFFIPLILILPRLLGLTGVEMAQMIADICAFLLAIPLVVSVWREM
ncbi:MAG: MATE family efflux transporter [Lachnospiraceae bacterium]|nr:MATE family efflux transporter [Lachnospiraceae bacterium]